MSAFKKLNRQDVFVSDYIAKKSWTASYSELDELGIEILPAASGSVFENPPNNDRDPRLIYQSIKQMYYQGIEGGVLSGSADVSIQSTIAL